MIVLAYVAIFLCSCVIEVGWIVAVRFVHSNQTAALVVSGMAMQAIGYCNTLILVSNSTTMITGVIGSGVGVLVAMRFPVAWFRRSDPTG